MSDLEKATSEAVKVIASAAEEARRVLAKATAEALNVKQNADSSYSKRELDYFLNEWGLRMDKQDKTLGRIEDQTTSTKERVDKHDWWIRVFYWALGVIITTVILFFPTFRWIVHQDILNTTHQAVDDAFNSRFGNIEVR